MPIDPRAWKGFIFVTIVASGITFFLPGLFLPGLFAMACHLAFFRDPVRPLPPGDGPLSPADGRVCEIETCFEDRFLKEEAWRVGVFLSVFDVHVNRSPIKGALAYQKYEKGKFLNALDKESVKVNECNWLGIDGGERKALVRQISGAIARRIHCDVTMGEGLARGGKIGIICYGSRAEIYLPKRLFRPSVTIGQYVKAGQTILGEWVNEP